MSILYLVRHAHADWVPNEQRPLSEQGMSDALRVADLLAAKPITFLYASSARRAAQTIEPLAARLNMPI
ncbi:MAG: histidine phosphatase family protein, partial [Chloroflexi bacterium]